MYCLSARLKRVWPLALAACKLFNNRDTLPYPPPSPPPHLTQVFPSWRLYKDLLSEYTSTCDVAASIQIFCFEIVHFVGLVSEGESDSLQSPTYSPRCLLLGWESFTLVRSTNQIVKPLFLRPLRLLLFVEVQIHEIGCLRALSFLINSMFLEIRL